MVNYSDEKMMYVHKIHLIGISNDESIIICIILIHELIRPQLLLIFFEKIFNRCFCISPLNKYVHIEKKCRKNSILSPFFPKQTQAFFASMLFTYFWHPNFDALKYLFLQVYFLHVKYFSLTNSNTLSQVEVNFIFFLVYLYAMAPK